MTAEEIRARLLALRDQVGPDHGPPSPPLAGYLEKVRRRAVEVTDADVAALLAAGLGEDQVYEATMRTAITAGIERFDAGMRALRGARR